ncbi:MAG: SAM-dependent methyltransferase [Hyphomicrobiales bacterium]
MSKKGKLYLIPTTIGDCEPEKVLPNYTIEIARKLNVFIVEQVRTARRFLSKLNPVSNIEDMTFYPLNKHTKENEIFSYFDEVLEGKDIGLLSEAGTPCVADPGSVIVEIAQRKGIEVVPLVGPNSILMALMASGFNGQAFTFHGYLPIDSNQRAKKLKELELDIKTKDQTQIFIEAPYRNHQLVDAICKSCSPSTMLCVATDITLDTENIKTFPVSIWKKKKLDFHKKPSLFLLYK